MIRFREKNFIVFSDSVFPSFKTFKAGTNNNNNNNKRICIAQVCRMTSEALGGQLQSCYTARARPKCLTEEKCLEKCSDYA